jgi:biopolymer transport protein ExbD
VPPDLSGVPVAQQDLLTIYIGRDGRIFYSDGAADPKPLSSSELRRFAVDRNETHGNDLVTVLKADPDVPYASMIEVLDRLNLAESDLAGLYIGRGEIRERRFTVAAMSDVDRRRIAAAMER